MIVKDLIMKLKVIDPNLRICLKKEDIQEGKTCENFVDLLNIWRDEYDNTILVL